MLHGLSSLITGGVNHINLLYIMVLLPALLALATMLIPAKNYLSRAGIFLFALAVNFFGSWGAFLSEEFSMLFPWGGFEMHLALRLYGFSGFIMFCIGIAALLVGIYGVTFLRDKSYSGAFLGFYLLTVALANGAVLANNLVVLLFFWEGLLITLFAMIVLGNRKDVSAAVKALIISGVADLLLMLGIAITAWQAGTLMIDEIIPLPIEGLGTVGFVCLMLGALGKAGAMPFHSWIPDAAKEAPLPFMAFLPGALEKLLGIYLLVRITRDIYALEHGSGMSTLLMTIGAITIILAVAMALIQKDMKRLLSYHAISQVGYMVLGVGTALPVGIVGALFHMLNNAIYKSCLFLSAGALELRCGTTDLRQMGGMRRLMPFTTVAFIVAACSISGLPPFNGFFSKELIFDAALESGKLFYAAALLGAFMTAASFLKMGHAAFFGPLKYPQEEQEIAPREVLPSMYAPMLILAATCLLFGVANFLPLSVIQGVMGDFMEGHNYSGWPHSLTLVLISLAVLLLAVGNHIFGVKKTGAGVGAVDHIHYAPGLHQAYNAAEKRYFDPYEWLMVLIKGYAWLCYGIDRAIDWIYNVLSVKLMQGAAAGLSAINNGRSSRYMVWAFTGMVFVLLMFIVKF